MTLRNLTEVPGVCFRHTMRGVLLGTAAGAVAGVAEATSLLVTAHVARAALREAAGYALVVDTLFVAAASGLLALLVGLAGSLAAGRCTERPLVATHTLAAIGFAVFAAGYLWYDRLRLSALDLASGSVPSESIVWPALAAAAALGAFAIYTLAGRRVAGGLVKHPRVVVLVTGAAVLTLGSVIPAQMAVETRGYPLSGQTTVRGNGLAPAARAAFDPVDFGTEGLSSSAGAWTGRRMNVVLITIDALRADHLGACGAAGNPTPNLDRLAAAGTLFCAEQVQQPQTNPSLSTLFTGLYPASHGVRAHMTDRLPESIPTLATMLRADGYATAGIASWTSLQPAFSGLQQGFDTYLVVTVGQPWYLDYPMTQAAAGVYRRIKDQLWVGRHLPALSQAQSTVEEQIDGRADVTSDTAIAWLAGHQREPLLLWVHYFDPHYPWTPPPPYDRWYDPDYAPPRGNGYDGTWRTFRALFGSAFAPQPRDVQHLRALYTGEVSFADAEIGRLVAAYEQAGLLANTLFVITADHGEEIGDHVSPTNEYGNWLHGTSLYATDLQVPLIFAGPGVPRGQRPERLVREIDVLPTLLDLLGLPPPPRPVDGRSLVPLAAGDGEAASPVSVSQLADDSILAVVASDGWKLVINFKARTVELFNLREDSQETNNQAGKEPERVHQLFGELDRWAESKHVGWLKQPESRFAIDAAGDGA